MSSYRKKSACCSWRASLLSHQLASATGAEFCVIDLTILVEIPDIRNIVQGQIEIAGRADASAQRSIGKSLILLFRAAAEIADDRGFSAGSAHRLLPQAKGRRAAL